MKSEGKDVICRTKLPAFLIFTMFIKIISTSCSAFVFILANSVSATSGSENTIYYHSFSGSSSFSLLGQIPDIRPGAEIYISNDGGGRTNAIRANGAVTSSFDANYCLPFQPAVGQIYELSIAVSNAVGGSGDWVGIAFLSEMPQPGTNLTATARGMLSLRANGYAEMRMTDGDINETGLSVVVTNLNTQIAELMVTLDTRPLSWTVNFRVDGQTVGTGVFTNSNPGITHIGIGKRKSCTGMVDDMALNILCPQVAQEAYPKMTWFRISQFANRYTDYSAWEKTFSPLMGVMGKALSEEYDFQKTGDTAGYYSELKKRFPEKQVINHFHGKSRLPSFEPEPFFSGHWIYYSGTNVTQTRTIPAVGATQWVSVADAQLFNYGADKICYVVFAPRSNGLPDWTAAEHALLTAVDVISNRIRVVRGFKNSPIALQAGSTYVAQQASDDGGNWFYNYSTNCPEDSSGKTCSDRLIEQISGWFAPGGALESFDGIEFDVMPNMADGFPNQLRNGFLLADCNGDGIGDGGIFNGENAFGAGVEEFLKGLRIAANMTNRYVMADGVGERPQRAAGVVGIEAEDFPSNADPQFITWSSAMNQLNFWKKRNADTNSYMADNHLMEYSYIADKRISPSSGGTWSEHRLLMGVATALELGVAMHNFAVDSTQDTYDETRGDAFGCGGLGWLGAPVGGLKQYVLDHPDQLGGLNASEMASLMSSPDGDVSLSVSGDAVLLTPAGGKDEYRVRFNGLPLGMTANSNAVIRLFLKNTGTSCVPRAAVLRLYNPYYLSIDRPEVVRVAKNDWNWMIYSSSASWGAEWDEIKFKDESGIENHRHFWARPPDAGVTNFSAICWEKTVDTPPNAALNYYIRKNSDGGSGAKFKLSIRDNTAGTGFVRIDSQSRLVTTNTLWQAMLMDLSGYAGHTITLRFEIYSVDSNTSGDTGSWGDVRIDQTSVVGGDDIRPADLETLFDSQDYMDSTFYFRLDDAFFTTTHPASADLDLLFEGDGDCPLLLKGLMVYHAPELLGREFENGTVLVNPANEAAVFYPEADFNMALKRINGSSDQDRTVNSGALIGITGVQTNESVIVGPKDAIFLPKE